MTQSKQIVSIVPDRVHSSSPELDRLLLDRRVPAALRALVEKVRISPHVGSTKGNRRSLTGYYPSPKTGRMQPWQSKSLELPMVLRLESWDRCHLYFSQPHQFCIPPIDRSAGANSYSHRPDGLALCVSEDADDPVLEVVFIECKFIKHLEAQPAKYLKDADGRWHHPAAEAYLQATFGPMVRYEHWTERDVNPIAVSNALFLSDYLSHILVVPDEIRRDVADALGRFPGSDLPTLFEHVPALDPDYANALMADGSIAFPVDREEARVGHRLHLFAEPILAATVMSAPTVEPLPSSELVLAFGEKLAWGNNAFEVGLVSGDDVDLVRDGRSVRFKRQELERLARCGEIRGAAIERHSVADALVDLDDKSEKPVLINTLRQVREIKDRELLDPEERRRLPALTKNQRRISQKMRVAEAAGVPFAMAFKPRIKFRGWYGRRLPDATPEKREANLALIRAAVAANLSKAAPYLRAIYRDYSDAAQRAGLTAVSRGTFTSYYKDISVEQRTRLREGEKAANAIAPARTDLSLLPARATRANAINLIDSTRIDLEAVDSVLRSPIGRPWLTLSVDSYSEFITAFVLLFDPPSVATLHLLMREYGYLHGQFPAAFASDNGPEYGSNFYVLLCAAYFIDPIRRPVANPRFGSGVELDFNSLNKFLFHNMLGNTKAMKNVRKVSRTHQPKHQAVWTLSEIYRVVAEWIKAHNDTPIHGLGKTPRQLYEESLAQHGSRPQRRVTYDDRYLALTMPEPERPTAKVRQGRVEIKGIPYGCAEFRLPGVEGTKVPVRWDPLNRSRAMACVDGRWVKVAAGERYAELNDLTERQRLFASQEITARLGREPKYHEYVAHLRTVREHETTVEALRAADQVTVLVPMRQRHEHPSADGWDVPTVVLPQVSLADIPDEPDLV